MGQNGCLRSRKPVNASNGTPAGDAGTGKVVQALAGHLDDRNDPDVGLAGGQLIGTRGGQGEAEIEGVAKGGIGRMLEAPDQGHRVQVADGAHAGLVGRKGSGIQELILSLGIAS